MGYDAWKTESRDDYEDRMHVHDRGSSDRPRATDSGQCSCGAFTTRSSPGFGWQCYGCGEAYLRQQYQRASQSTTPRRSVAGSSVLKD